MTTQPTSFVFTLYLARYKILITSLWLLLLVTGYALLAEFLGGFVVQYNIQLWVEAGMVLYLYGISYILLKPSFWRKFLAAVPLLLLYLTSDIFYRVFGKVFRLVNLNELPEMVEILPLTYSLPLLTVLSSIALILLLQLKWSGHNTRVTLLVISPLFATTLMLFNAPVALAHLLETAGTSPVKYSDAKSVENNGRLVMMLYRESQRLQALNNLTPYHNRSQYEQAVKDRLQPVSNVAHKRNVHLIVLESFIDPRLFSLLQFSQPPAHADFDTLFGQHLGLSISPVFGGATAQAEFEILCGVPALERLSSVEFNIFTGSAAHCLPGQLTSLGYYSSASNTYKPDFFNAIAGYQGAGFNVSHFPKEFTPSSATYLTSGDPGVEEYQFDGDLFAQNLSYVKSQLQQHPNRPFFNYLLTIYGHTPHLINTQVRPQKIALQSAYADDHLTLATNQFYYRTEAIAHFAKELIKVDPNSLIIFIADHVPPLRNGPNTYEALSYLNNIDKAYYHNRLMIIDAGKPALLPVIHHYDIPALVLNYLSNGAYCDTQPCAFTDGSQRNEKELLSNYLKLMANASE